MSTHYCKINDLYCTVCDIRFRVQCQKSINITKLSKLKLLKLDLQELEKSFYSKYQEIETHIRDVKTLYEN